MGARRARILAELGHTVFCRDFEVARAESLAAEVGGYVLNSAPVEAAFISTWPASHIHLALEAARSGAHVFIEKPLALFEDGLDELEREAEAHGVKVMVGCNWRFHPVIASLPMIVGPSKLDIEFTIAPRGTVGESLERGGGVMLDMGSHALDLATHILGPMTHFLGGWPTTTMHGIHTASMLLSYTGTERRRLTLRTDGQCVEHELTPDPIMYEHEMAHFLRATETGAPHMNPLSEARDTLRRLLKVGK